MIKKLCALVIFALATVAAMAQPSDPMSKIPIDSAVRIGTLENGMKYYIRHNSKPENQGEFYIFHNVGAIQEDDSQIGLAHFLEHMAFNGTKNLPGNMLKDYLETVGVRFGVNLNAGTGQDMTVYNMSAVPLSREGIIDTALLILHDWSHFISLDPVEIDKERGVIIEELRTGNNANFRVSQATRHTLFNNSKYADRNIIGEEELLRNFSHQELVDFYHRWYRPDLQALIIVGDFDVDEMEQKVIKAMADVPASENPVEKKMYEIPGNEEPLIAVASDPELSRSSVSFLIKHPPVPHEMNDCYIVGMLNVMKKAVSQIGNFRLFEISQKADAPFTGAQMAQTSLTATTDVFLGALTARDGETASAFEALYTEIERIRRYGFTEGELQRVKTEFMRAAETTYDSRYDRRNGDFIWAYIDNFRNNSPMPTADTQWEMDSLYISNLNLGELNMFAKKYLEAKNEVVIVSSPEKENIEIPSEENIRDIMTRVRLADIEGPEADVELEPLISEELKGSPIVAEENDIFGATVWTLENGARVIVKQTDFRADEVITFASAEGGLSLVSDEDYTTGSILGSYISISGLDKFSETELWKQLAGKSVRLDTYITDTEAALSGKASVKDFETLLQLTYLNLTSPRFNKDDYELLIDKLESQLKNTRNAPNYIFRDSLMNTLYDHNIRMQVLTVEKLQDIEYNKLEQIHNKLYDGANNFTFIYVGNINPNDVRPLIEKYIGSIPKSANTTSWVDDKVRVVDGKVDNRFTVSMQAPKTTVIYIYSGMLPYTLENQITLQTLSQILQIRYTASIREEKGGSYGVGVSGNLKDLPEESYLLQAYFDTNPEMADELMEIVSEEIETIAKEGPLAEDLAKVKEYLVKQRADNLKMNNTWLNYINAYYSQDIDLNSDYDRLVKELNADKIKSLATKLIEDGNLVRVIMDPKGKADDK